MIKESLHRYLNQVLATRAQCIEGLIADFLLRHPDTSPDDWVLVENRDSGAGLVTRWWLEPKQVADRREWAPLPPNGFPSGKPDQTFLLESPEEG